MERWSAGDLCERADRAFNRMSNMLLYWQAIAELFYPERADFTSKAVPGDERYWDIFDEEAMLLRRDLANQLGAMLRPRGRDWFMAKAYPRHLNDLEDVKAWCEDATMTMREVIYSNGANFTKAFSESDNDYAAFGNSVLVHSYNSTRTGLMFRCGHPRDYAWYENQDGMIDEMYERMPLTLRQIDEMGFVVPRQWVADYEKDKNKEVEIIRCVMPIENYASGKAVPKRARYGVAYLAKGIKEELKAKNGADPWFRTWPFLVRRWMSVSGETWGRSPCTSVALATTRTLNQAALSIIESLEKLVNPPLLAPDDGIFGEVQIRAGGISYYDPTLDYGSRKPIEALDVGRPDFGMEYAKDRQAFLARAFLQNLIKFPQLTKEMTAYEASKLFDQYMRDAAPVFEPMEAENGQLMEGVFERIYDADGPGKTGAFEPPPDDLAGAEVKFEFDTPLSQAYKRLKYEQAREGKQYVAESEQLGDHGAGDLLDMDAVNRDALGAIVPQKWIRKQADVEQIRAQREQQQQMMQAAQAAMEAAKSGLLPKAAPQPGGALAGPTGAPAAMMPDMANG